jgi:hypothetical protein
MRRFASVREAEREGYALCGSCDDGILVRRPTRGGYIQALVAVPRRTGMRVREAMAQPEPPEAEKPKNASRGGASWISFNPKA